MNQESSDRIPVSSLILFASLVFTLTTYFIFKVLWEVDIHALWLLVVLGLQLAVLLLGGSKVLTRLGAAALSALIAVAVCIGALFIFFPPILELKIAGAVGGGTALIFIMASFVAASRVDPVPSGASEPLVMGKIEDDQTAELIKYGAVHGTDPIDTQYPPLFEEPHKEVVEVGQPVHTGAEPSPNVKETVYEFDELSESKLGLSLDVESSFHGLAPLDLDEEIVTLQMDELLSPEVIDASSEPDPGDEPAIPDDWVQETARYMEFETAGDTTADIPGTTPGDTDVTRAVGVAPLGKIPAATGRIPGFGMRTRYKVLDAASGEHYETYFGDEGYSTLDPVSLSALLSPKLATGELRIVKLDWSNFDEVEVHVKVDEVVPMELDVDVKDDIDETRILAGEVSQPEIEAVSGSGAIPPVAEPVPESQDVKAEPAANPSGPRYMIYDRRTIQPMGEYFPEGDSSRIDRLTLYKMFPEYNFKTFEIDSIRWEDDEVRILIRGEKKQSPKPEVQSPKKSSGQDK